MNTINELSEQIKVLKAARDILKEKYSDSEYHKKRETFPHEAVPPSPEDEDILKLLTAIHQLEKYVKELQRIQFELIKNQE